MTARTAEASTVPEPLGKPGGPGLFGLKGKGLPPYIQHVRNELIKQGKSESQATQMAIGIVRNWAEGHNAGKGNVHADVQAAAAKAIAEYDRLRAEAKARPNKSHAHANDAEGIDLAVPVVSSADGPRVTVAAKRAAVKKALASRRKGHGKGGVKAYKGTFGRHVKAAAVSLSNVVELAKKAKSPLTATNKKAAAIRKAAAAKKKAISAKEPTHQASVDKAKTAEFSDAEIAKLYAGLAADLRKEGDTKNAAKAEAKAQKAGAKESKDSVRLKKAEAVLKAKGPGKKSSAKSSHKAKSSSKSHAAKKAAVKKHLDAHQKHMAHQAHQKHAQHQAHQQHQQQQQAKSGWGKFDQAHSHHGWAAQGQPASGGQAATTSTAKAPKKK